MNLAKLRPRQMTSSDVRGIAILAVLLAAGIAVCAVLGWFVFVQALVLGSFWGLVALSLSLVFGIMQIPSFATGEYFLVGSMTSYLVYKHVLGGGSSAVYPIIAIAAGALAGYLAGSVTNWAILSPLRRRESGGSWVVRTFIVTIGISILLQNVDQVVFGPNFFGVSSWWGGSVSVGGTVITTDQLVCTVIALITAAALGVGLKATSLGRRMRAVADDELGASLLGIDVGKVHRRAYSLSCSVAALSGACLLFIFPASPTSGEEPLLIAWIVVMLAGLGNIFGAVAAAYVVSLTQGVTDQVLGTQWENVVIVCLIIGVLLIIPKGLFGRLETGVWMD